MSLPWWTAAGSWWIPRRSASCASPVGAPPNYENDTLEEELPQLVHKTKDLTFAGNWTARYSLCDLNGHVNNSCYLDIACDALPLEVLRKGPLRFASIKYHREIPMGGRGGGVYAPSADGWYVVGRREEHMAFECYLEFADEGTQKVKKRITKDLQFSLQKLLQNGFKRVTIWLQKAVRRF